MGAKDLGSNPNHRANKMNIEYTAQWCNGSHAGLKILWTEVSVSVRVRPELLNIIIIIVAKRLEL